MSMRKLIWFSLVLAMMLLGVTNNASAALVSQYEFEGDYSPTVGTATGTTPSTTAKYMGTNYTYANGATIVTDGTTIGSHSFGDVVRVSSTYIAGDNTTTLDYVKIGNTDLGTIGGAFTFAAWVKFDGTNWSAAFLSAGYDIALRSDSVTGYGGYFASADISADIASANDVFTDGQWHHIATTFDGSYLRMYIDGQQDGMAVSASGTIGLYYPAAMGIRFSSLTAVADSTAFDGWLDDVRSYDDAQSLAQIQSWSGVPEPTTVALLGFGCLFLLRRRR